MKKLLFIPCYNDINNCKLLLDEINIMSKIDFDILIVNDGSLEYFDLKIRNLNLKIINLKNNFGVGLSMKIAINFALRNNYQQFCRIDCDGEHDPAYIQSIFHKLDKYDFILGQRNISYKESPIKLLSKHTLKFIISKLFRLKLKDYNCGMMGFNKVSMKKLYFKNLINYPEPQIIIELCSSSIKYETINIFQRKWRNFCQNG